MASLTWTDPVDYWPIMVDGVDVSASLDTLSRGEYYYIHYVVSPSGYNAWSKTKYKYIKVQVGSWMRVDYGYYFTREEDAIQALEELKEFHRKAILGLLNREIKKAIKATNKHGLDPQSKSINDLLNIEKIIEYAKENT